MRYLILALTLTGCEVKPVKCKETDTSYVKGMVCHCVYSCETMRTNVWYENDGFCSPLCYVEK